jgi:CHRD domain
MKHFREASVVVALGLLLTVAACTTSPTDSMSSTGSAGKMSGMVPTTQMPNPLSTSLSTTLSGASEAPPVTTDATGTMQATLAAASNVLTWKVTYSGLSGPLTMAHFHGPAMPGQNAAVVVPMNSPLTSPMTGSATLTPGQAAEIMAGEWYVNLHTAANPNGEIRGQIIVGR